MRYDVQELRQTAKSVRKAAEAVQEGGRRSIREVQSSLTDHFRGKAAEALNTELQALWADFWQLISGLNAISGELEAFAKRLEQADRDSAENIQQK